MPAPLLLAGTLFLSPQHPATLPISSETIWVSQPNTVQVQALGDRVVLTGLQEGLAHLTGLKTSTNDPLRVQVLSPQNYRALEKCPQVKWEPQYSPPRLLSLKDLPQTADCGFQRLQWPAALSTEDEQLFSELNRRLLEQAPFRVQSIESLEGRFLIKIYSNKSDIYNKYLNRILGPYRPFYLVEELHPPRPGRTLIFSITLFEFSKTRARSLGLNWPQGVHFQGLGGAAVATASPTRWSWEGNLGADFGESQGVGRVLARPQIRTKPGEKAVFQSGGEIPIRNSSLNSAQTIWKNYGLMVTLEPNADTATGAGEVTVHFQMELSEPDPGTALQGVPGMRVRRLESRFDLRTDEMTILTTLLQMRQGSTRTGLPGFTGVSWLRTLFSKNERNEQDTELWLAIRPTWEELHVP